MAVRTLETLHRRWLPHPAISHPPRTKDVPTANDVMELLRAFQVNPAPSARVVPRDVLAVHEVVSRELGRPGALLAIVFISPIGDRFENPSQLVEPVVLLEIANRVDGARRL